MKIQIVGYSGSGKSTLAKVLGEIFNAPVLHLDNVHFYGNWQERTKEEQEEIVNQFLTNENWVIDGNYSSIGTQRFTDADITIFLMYNRFYCYKMARKRYKEFKGTKRDSCDSPEKFDFEFAKWILYDGRTKKRRNNLLAKAKMAKKYYVFKNVKEKNKFLEEVKNNYLNK